MSDTIKSISNPGVHGGVVVNPDGTNIGSTAPSSLPLPTGAATSANQTNGSQKTQVVDANGNTYGNTQGDVDATPTGVVIMHRDTSDNTVYGVSDTEPLPVTLGIDQPVDLAKINGITTSVGAGASDTGTQRVVTALVSAPLVGQKAMTGSAVQLQTNTLVNGVIITAKSTNAANIIIGTSGVTTTADGSGNGYILEPGASVSFAGTNTNLLYAIGTSGDVLSFIGC